MAATTAFSTLAVPAPEDTMEISSPARLADDNDIDLDFDSDYGGGMAIEGEEQMVVDGEQTSLDSMNDASMDDDAQHATPEEHMPDGQIPEDDELIDYDEEVPDQTALEDTFVEDQPQEAVEDIHHAPTSPKVEHEASVEEVGSVAEPDQTFDEAEGLVEVPQNTGDEHAVSHNTILNEDEATSSTDKVYPRPDEGQISAADEATSEVVPEDVYESGDDVTASFPAPLTVDTAVQTADDTAATPTDTGLHPVTFFYDEMALPLFKSKHQQDGLLKDDNLSSLSLAELMRACRHRLRSKLGRNVPEEQDLVLSFAQLGLIVVENSRCAFQSSLHDVIEVYLLLHHNDGVRDAPSLSLTLTQQFKFSSNLAMLKQRAESGEGLPRLAVQSADADGEQEFYGEGNDENEHVDPAEPEATHRLDETNNDDSNVEGQSYAEGGYQQEGDNEDAQDEQEGENAAQLEHQAGYHDGKEHFENEPSDGEQFLDQPFETHMPANSLEHASSGHHTGEAAEENAQANMHTIELADNKDDAPSGHAPDGSTTSSRTAQGEDEFNTAGEYDEDFIDWDDHSDLTSKSSDVEAEDQDDFSTFLTEYEAEETAAATLREDAETDDRSQHTEEAVTPFDDTTVAEAQDDQHFQDTLHENEEAYEPDGAEAAEQSTFVEGEEEQHEIEKEEYTTHEDPNEDHHDQADTFDEQQEDSHQAEPQEADEDEEAYDTHEPVATQELNEVQAVDLDEEVDQAVAHIENGTAQSNDDELLDPEDDLIFDDETTEQHEAKRKASQPEVAPANSGSPLGKRSFDEHTDLFDDDDDDDGEPDPKKARSE